MSPSCRTLSPFGIGGVSCLHSRGSRRPTERCRRRRSRSARSSRSQRAVIAAWVGCCLAVKRPANFSTRGAFHPRIAVRVPAILFLGASVSQVAAIRQARASGFRVVAVDADPDGVGFADADAAEAVDFTDIDGVLEVACRYKIDAVVAISTDRAVPIAAAVSERLALPGIGTETALVMTDKAAMRARLKQAAIPQPSFVVVDEHADPAWQLEAIGFPAVLKPIDSGGQRGVYRIDDHASLAEHLPLSLSCSRSGRAILEQYGEGRPAPDSELAGSTSTRPSSSRRSCRRPAMLRSLPFGRLGSATASRSPNCSSPMPAKSLLSRSPRASPPGKWPTSFGSGRESTWSTSPLTTHSGNP